MLAALPPLAILAETVVFPRSTVPELKIALPTLPDLLPFSVQRVIVDWPLLKSAPPIPLAPPWPPTTELLERVLSVMVRTPLLLIAPPSPPGLLLPRSVLLLILTVPEALERPPP